jgi:hypothetical protein
MSPLRRQMDEIRRGFWDRVDRLRRILARTTPGPVLVRLGVYLIAVLAQALAYPAQLMWSRAVVVILVLAALPALFPRTPAVSAFWLLTALGWVVATTGYGEVASVWRLGALAGALYLVHTGAALAAVLPYDAVVEPVVVARWLVRASAMVALSVGVAYAALNWVAPLGEQRSFLVASVLGLALMVGLVGYLVRAWRAR